MIGLAFLSLVLPQDSYHGLDMSDMGGSVMALMGELESRIKDSPGVPHIQHTDIEEKKRSRIKSQGEAGSVEGSPVLEYEALQSSIISEVRVGANPNP